MLFERNELSNGEATSPAPRRPSWRRWGGLVSVLAVGMVSGALVMSAFAAPKDKVKDPKGVGDQACWGKLKGGLPKGVKLVLAFDEDLEVQGLFGPGGSRGKDDGGGGELKETLAVEILKYNPEWCYKINNVQHCVTY